MLGKGRIADAFVTLYYSATDAEPADVEDLTFRSGPRDEEAASLLAPSREEGEGKFYQALEEVRGLLPEAVAKRLTFALESGASQWASGAGDAAFILGKAVGRRQAKRGARRTEALGALH